MKKVLSKLALTCMVLFFGIQVFAQNGHIDLQSNAKGVQATQVSMKGLQATFSFNSIESTQISTEKGTFSAISMDKAYPSGEAGTPSLPVARELVAVPFGATPVVTVKNYTTTEYNLSEYGIEKIYPQQLSVRKDTKPEEVPFYYNKAAYSARAFNEQQIAEFEMVGTMRGIQIGALQVRPVSYNPSNNTIRVYNDIELEITFDNADLELTEKTLVNTYSPYFDVVYKQMFNYRAINDVYDDHPDLWATPVKVLVIANRMFEDVMQPWLEWKTQKGFYLDVNYTDEIGSSANELKTFCQTKYNDGVAAGQAPTFIVIFGDKGQVVPSGNGSETGKVTDLYYGSIDNDYFPDMYYSRMSAETTDQMTAIINKILQYEQYTMPDPSYLSKALLIAGWDSSWTPQVAIPTINYATTYYYNTEHGFTDVYEYHNPYTGCYDHLNTGVGFANYTAHGGEDCWADPNLDVSDVNALTNTDKYFWAMGNCCVAADWGYSSTCFGEAMVRAENKAAFSYIGSCPNTYWNEDYYFGVGATHTYSSTPSYEESSMGVYDATWIDDSYNSLSSVVFVGNLAVTYASVTGGYQSSVTPLYYWQAYHVLGDGTITPYHINPVANSVQHLPTLPIGMDTYEVTADPGSYVGISKDGVLYGAGMIGEDGMAAIPMEPILSGGDVTIVVTHPQRQPYIATIPAASLNGAYIVYDSYTLNDANGQADYGEYIPMDVTIKNVGTQNANSINVKLTSDSEYVTILTDEVTVPAVNASESFSIEDVFDFEVAVNVPDKTKISFTVTCTAGSETWESKFKVEAHAPAFELVSITLSDDNNVLEPGETASLVFEVKNTGSTVANNTVFEVFSSSMDLVFMNTSFEIGAAAAGENFTADAEVVVAESVELGSTYEIGYIASAGHYVLQGTTAISVGNIIEGFETGDFSMYDWQSSGNANWSVVTESPYNGTYCAKSGAVNDYGSSVLELTVNVLADGEMSFFKKVSSESNYDKLHFYIDGDEKASWSGNVEWSQETYNVTIGQHNFKWEYKKDVSQASGSDCAWLDDIKFPPTNVITALDPVQNLEYAVNGNQVTLTWDAVAGAGVYVVTRNGVALAPVFETTLTETVADGVYNYSVIATNDTGLNSMPSYITVNVGTVDVEEITEIQFSVYPNPANDVINIKCSVKNYEYSIFNSLGQQVVNGTATGEQQVNVSSLNNGMYFMKIVANGETQIQKIILQ